MVSTIEIGRAPRDVYAYATDPSHFVDWQRDVVGAHMSGESRFVTTRRVTGGERTLTQEIIRNDPPVAGGIEGEPGGSGDWAARGVDGPIRPYAAVSVEPLAGGTRSRVTFTLDFEGHGLGVPLVPLVRRQASKVAPVSYDNLKRLLEDQGGQEPDQP